MVKLSSFLAALVAIFASHGNSVSFATMSSKTKAPDTNTSTNELPSLIANATTIRAKNNTKSLTVKSACVLANFQTATGDFTALNNVVPMIKMTPSIIKPYVSDPLIIENQTMSAQNISFLGTTFEAIPTINWLNVSGITAVAPMPVNVTSSNRLRMGVEFTGTVTFNGTLTIRVTQPGHKWYQLCWIDLLHPIKCPPHTMTVDVTLAVNKPQFVTNIEANVYECAPEIPASVCQNLTTTTIIAGALGGNMTGVSAAIYKNFKDAKINKLLVDWNLITKLEFTFHNATRFTSRVANSLLGFSTKELNKKGDYYHLFLRSSQKFLLSLMNNIINTMLEPLFGATCL